MTRGLKFRIKEEVKGLYYYVSKTKAQLIFAFVFANAKVTFSHGAAQFDNVYNYYPRGQETDSDSEMNKPINIKSTNDMS